MVTVKVLKAFHGIEEGRDFVAGDEFDATDERGAEIAERIPGFVEVRRKAARRRAKRASDSDE